MVCEDMWTADVAEGLEESGAEILIVPNGSPFEPDKQDLRIHLAVARVTETGLPIVYATRSAARTSWCSTAPRSCRRRSPARRAGQVFEEACC